MCFSGVKDWPACFQLDTQGFGTNVIREGVSQSGERRPRKQGGAERNGALELCLVQSSGFRFCVATQVPSKT